MGIPPTGKKIELAGIQIERNADGKIVEHWRISDDLGMLTQLGVVGS
jgi:predicted ester cyclase